MINRELHHIKHKYNIYYHFLVEGYMDEPSEGRDGRLEQGSRQSISTDVSESLQYRNVYIIIASVQKII